MTNKIILKHSDIDLMVQRLAKIIKDVFGEIHPFIYGVPRGGIYVAYALQKYLKCTIVDSPNHAEVIVDDLIDSGSTENAYKNINPNAKFYALLNKQTDLRYTGKWIEFPWEANDSSGIDGNIVRLLQYVGEDSAREGLLETPARVAKAWKHWTSGYDKDPVQVLKVFEDGANGYDQMVIVKDIPVYSKCEHHLADIFGTATVAYIPDGKIVGLSKLSRVVDIFARRLQVQERLTSQIADAINDNLEPKGVGVIIKARHMCMESRGICQQGHHTITSALRGVIKDDALARAEFLALMQ